jgi:Tat protein secretion system quality control protein TatD with DNase activity
MRERGAALRAALREGVLPLAQLMLETDSPFMRPDREHLPEVRREPAWD